MALEVKRSGALVLRLIVGLALLGWARVGAAQGTWSEISLPQQPGEVLDPAAVAVDAAGNLYVTDRGSGGRIQRRDAQERQRDADPLQQRQDRADQRLGQVHERRDDDHQRRLHERPGAFGDGRQRPAEPREGSGDEDGAKRDGDRRQPARRGARRTALAAGEGLLDSARRGQRDGAGNADGDRHRRGVALGRKRDRGDS